MISTASSNISRRTAGGGHRVPMTCSLSASPVPSPRKNRPSNSSDVVAAACAITAGWMRTIGHVTPTPTCMRSVLAAMPPSTLHTNGLCPCADTHGW